MNKEQYEAWKAYLAADAAFGRQLETSTRGMGNNEYARWEKGCDERRDARDAAQKKCEDLRVPEFV